ncbi:MAG: T9SS type A sorting domain-containing protein, partial [Bacteroidota bacterium]|nr:T9SS type A sorting domain-containing protein [Bacteroidota bacterium]
ESMPAGVAAYPNPVINKVEINIDSRYKAGNDLILFDLPGRIYKPKSVKKLSDNSFEVDLTGLEKGVYFIKIKLNDSYKTFRIIKL